MAQTGSSFGLARIGQIAMTVKDLERAIAFYRDQLGMRFLFQAPPSLAFFDCDGIRLMLSLSEKPGENFSSIVYFRVDQIESAYETLTARGVGFEAKPAHVAKLETHDVWLAFFRDPDRNLLALMSEVPRAA